MVLRLMDQGFVLVADDRVDIADGVARPAPELAGLLEVRGLGIMRLPHLGAARLRLAVALAAAPPRLPVPAWNAEHGLPQVTIDPARIAAARHVALALDCVLGRVRQLAGAFA
jgi:HPr kinase/phosphorylase